MPQSKRNKSETKTHSIMNIIIIIYLVFLKSTRVDTELHYKEDYITEAQHPGSLGTFG